jgi:hypothetical protein
MRKRNAELPYAPKLCVVNQRARSHGLAISPMTEIQVRVRASPEHWNWTDHLHCRFLHIDSDSIQGRSNVVDVPTLQITLMIT